MSLSRGLGRLFRAHEPSRGVLRRSFLCPLGSLLPFRGREPVLAPPAPAFAGGFGADGRDGGAGRAGVGVAGRDGCVLGGSDTRLPPSSSSSDAMRSAVSGSSLEAGRS